MKSKTTTILTYLILLLGGVSCLISIRNNDLYQDGEWANVQWLGQDIVTLFIGLPLIYWSFSSYKKHNEVTKLVIYAGGMFYLVYTYAFFMFVANLTFLYLFHVPIFGMSIVGLMLAMGTLFYEEKIPEPSHGWIKWAIVVYSLLMCLMIDTLWLIDIFSHLFVPNHLSATPDGKAPLIIYSLDLAIVIPIMITGAWGYIQKKEWGYILMGIMMVKTSTLGFSLMGMTLSMYVHGLENDLTLTILWCVLGIIGTGLTGQYLKSMR